MSTTVLNNTLLILDDEPGVVKALDRELSAGGWDIHSFTRPFDALEMLRSAEVAVIISDQCMPQMEGSHFLREVKRLQPDAVQILISGYGVGAGYHPGIWRSFAKPWNACELRSAVATAFRRFNGCSEELSGPCCGCAQRPESC